MILSGTPAFWKATLALCCGSFLVFSNVYLAQPLLPLFTEVFGVDPHTATWAISANTLSLSIALLFYGPLSDAFGRKNLMVWTMFLAIISTLLTSLAPNFALLIVGRVVQGLFLACLASTAIAYIGEEFEKKAVPLAIGIYISGNTVGGMVGRILSGYIADLWGWRHSFLIIGTLGLVLFLLFARFVPPSRHFQPQPFGLKKAVRELAGHLKNPVLLLAYLVGSLHFFVFLGDFNYLTYLLSGEPYYLSPTFLGLLFVTYLAGTVGSTVAGKGAQKIGQGPCIGIGIAIYASGLLLTLLPSLWFILLGLLLNCFGVFFAHSAANAWVNQNAKTAKASASALYFVFYYLGGSLGSTYLGFFWDAWRWPGVVGGSLLVLCFTTACMLRIVRYENPPTFKTRTG